MKIFAIRHTTVEIDPGICYGQSDVQIADTFEEEKEKILKELTEFLPVDKVISSPLTRCKILAETIFPASEIIFDDRLKELNFGDWELKSWEEIYHSHEGKAWMENYRLSPALNGESYPEMQNRVELFLTEMKLQNYAAVGVVTHAGVIRIMKSVIEKIPVERLFETYRPAYGSITVFQI